MTSYFYRGKSGLPEDPKLLANAKVLAYDVESTGPHVGIDLPVGFSLAYSPDSAYYGHIEDPYLRPILADPSRLKVAHNASFDRSMAKKAGITIDNLCCTMIAAHLLERTELSLKMLSLLDLGLDVVSYSDVRRRMLDMTGDELLRYSGPHSRATLMLWGTYRSKLSALGLLNAFWNIEMPLVPVISDMELNGVMVDPAVLSELDVEFSAKIDSLNEALSYWSNTSGINFNSPDQVADLFYDKLGIKPPWQMTGGGRPSVNVAHLKEVKNNHPILPIYYMFKSYMTLKNSYLKSLAKQIQSDGRVYGSFNQTNTRTSRLSSSEPNLQKIPVRTSDGKRIRGAFVAPEGKVLLKGDYDQIELRKLAICSGDKNLLAAFKAGRDIHTETAIRVFGDAERRREAKTLNFQIVYGGGGIYRRNMFLSAYPRVKEWIDETTAEVRRTAIVKTLGGRRRTIHGHEVLGVGPRHEKMLSHGDREAISTIVQGSSAESVKTGMRRIWEKTKDTDVKMLLQVHDELVFEVPESILMDVAKVVDKEMTCNDYEIPLTVSLEVGKSWGNMTKLAL